MQTPVVGILGLWELVETQASEQSKIMMGEVAPMMRDCIQSLQVRVSRSAIASANSDSTFMSQRLIKDILDMSKLHQGLIKFNFSDFDAAELFRSSVSMAQRSCGQKPVQIRLENHTSESLMIHSDPVRLNQVLTNVLSNAVKFTDNGTISVHLWIEKDSDDDSSKAMFCFSVEDTGVGIPEKFIEGEIFHTFSQTSEGRSRGGSGLGLAISRQIVQALHGTISCRR
jgi:two-component system autoinducer 2 sensor kinase/phosphatase LuxQ